jgi:hypothetical protein
MICSPSDAPTVDDDPNATIQTLIIALNKTFNLRTISRPIAVTNGTGAVIIFSPKDFKPISITAFADHLKVSPLEDVESLGKVILLGADAPADSTE